MSKPDVRRLLSWSRSCSWARWPLAIGLVTVWWWTFWAYASWLLPWRAMLAVLVVVVALSGLVTAMIARRHPWLFSLAVLVSPCAMVPAWTAGEAALGYARGTATYMSSGMPAGFFPYFLHPSLRVPMRYTGCMTDDVLELRIAVNNAVVESLVEHLGPMPGSYLDPLPTDEEVVQAIVRRGRPVPGAAQTPQWPVRVEHYLLRLRDDSSELRVAPLDDPRLLAVGWRWHDEGELRTVVIDLENEARLGSAQPL